MIELFGKIDENDLQYVRERYGEPRFSIPAPYIRNKDGSYKKINPHESRFIMPSGKFVSVFHIKPIYYTTLQGTWRPLYEVASYYGNKRGMTLKEGWENKIDMGYLVWYIKRLEILKSQYGVAVSFPQTYAGIELTPVQIPVLLNASPLTVYPDPDTETTTVDGAVKDLTSGQTWAEKIASAGTAATDSITVDSPVRIASIATENQWLRNYRAIFLFDTSSLGASAIISAATLSIWGQAKTDGLSITPDIDIYTCIPSTGNTALVAGDYNLTTATWGSTSQTGGAVVTYDGWVTSGYNAFVFNGEDGDPFGTTGIGSIVKDGVSKFGARNANYDVSGTPPTWTASLNTSFTCQFAEWADTTADPKLVVTYTVVATTYTVKETTRVRIKQTGITRATTTKGRVKTTISPKIQARSRIFQPDVTKLTTARGRIKITDITQKIQFRSRIKVTEEVLFQSQARLKVLKEELLSEKVRIKQTDIQKVLSSEARVKITGQDKLLSIQLRIQRLEEKLFQIQGRIKQFGISKLLSSKGRIKQEGISEIITSQARIIRSGISVFATSRAKLKNTYDKLLQTRARIFFSPTKLLLERGRIKQTVTVYL